MVYKSRHTSESGPLNLRFLRVRRMILGRTRGRRRKRKRTKEEANLSNVRTFTFHFVSKGKLKDHE